MDTKKKETEKTAAPTAAATNVTEKVSKPKSALELLEEDDEFEEFEGGSWEEPAGAAEENQLWQDDWEDDIVNDDFANHLREQIEARNNTAATTK